MLPCGDRRALLGSVGFTAPSLVSLGDASFLPETAHFRSWNLLARYTAGGENGEQPGLHPLPSPTAPGSPSRTMRGKTNLDSSSLGTRRRKRAEERLGRSGGCAADWHLAVRY